MRHYEELNNREKGEKLRDGEAEKGPSVKKFFCEKF